ncbi:hypothetical protein HELRODRAFT_108298 [Helobdella robusta]|uniref:GPI ethanolamine phosphate transferase 1 n=1 Tax=Helobdella robusta TaxID=6412 RepID=T1EEI1_HELRO|nr:hypothetical protein HELRODRAFT_108298 [Helobdella robusta]ESN91299.1 hypothetical protein HELRODRAFT_108298 [Helobdella robusta]
MDWRLIVCGLLLHLVLFYSIFDIYFTSPLVHGVPSHTNPLPPPAKRLVLFVSDGLRADKLFQVDQQSGSSHTPFLRSLAEVRGVWGVSHTRVPTESRPGHVALIAGFYEDVSAITKGWKENPVEFDSLFNQSSTTWSWGSPDILPMFKHGRATGDHVHAFMYPDHSEDFAAGDHAQLDTWVFRNVQDFFSQSNESDTSKDLHKSKIVFFLHLLGLDTTGHVHKPHSKNYVKNMKVVDDGVEKIVSMVEEFYRHDGRTAYIFTSDHGMTSWGSHGAGDLTETMTPFLAWGAGIRGPLLKKLRDDDDGGDDWKLNDVVRTDVNQADISALMSTLIGVPIAKQSVGTVPTSVLNTSMQFKAHSLLTNLRQVHEQYKVKEEEKRTTVFSALFTPFSKRDEIISEMKNVENLLEGALYEDVIRKCPPLIETILEGFQYYHQYDRFILGCCVTLSYVGWMLLITTTLIIHHTGINSQHQHHQQHHCSEGQGFFLNSCTSSSTSRYIRSMFKLSAVGVIIFLFGQHKPLMHYIYFLLPLCLWFLVIDRLLLLWGWLLLLLIFVVCCRYLLFRVVDVFIIVFSFIHRQLLSVGLLCMALWPWFQRSPTPSLATQAGWTASCILMSIFPLLPTVSKDSNYPAVFVHFISLNTTTTTTPPPPPPPSAMHRFIKCILVLVVLSGLIVWWFVGVRNNDAGFKSSSLASFLHFISWLILASSFILPLHSSTRIVDRIASISLSFFSTYILLSIAHESLFYLCLCLLMHFWVSMETNMDAPLVSSRQDFRKFDLIQRNLKASDVRCSFFFLFFLLTSFFGTGNIASINSFDPTSVLCFVSVFSPFVMGGLMLFKIIILFLVVTCCFHAIQVCTNVPTNSFFYIVFIISDYMALHFFFMVRDTGSWLDIGTSISHYVIVMSLIIFLFVIITLSRFLTEKMMVTGKFVMKSSFKEK